MDRIDAMRAFVGSVDRGSLASAARGLGCSPATVTRAIAFLERKLGTPLLRRNTRSLHLTPFGEAYLATCRTVLSAIDVAERDAAREQEQPSGLLTVTAPLRFGQLHVRPVLDAYLDAHPGVHARLLLLDRIVNLAEEGMDVAIRIARLPDSTLIATRLGEVRRIVCAAPDYILRRSVPTTPTDLREHACIMERDGAETDTWRFVATPGKLLRPVKVRPRLVVNSASAAVDSAVAGHGVARVMSYQAAEALAAGSLVILLARYEPPPIPVHLVLPPGRSGSGKPRSFVDFATPRLRGVLSRVTEDIPLERDNQATSSVAARSKKGGAARPLPSSGSTHN